MKKFLITASAAMALVAAIASANAQPGRNDRRDDNRRDNGRYEQSYRDNDRRDFRPSNYRHHKEWRKGYRLSKNDWNRGRRIDYRVRRLSAPPRGYEYREIDGNLVLGAIATGVIFSILANQ